MSESKIETMQEEMKSLAESLKTERDELNVQMHLAQAEARDEWERLEHTWERFHEKAQVVGDTASDASLEIGAAARLLGDELLAGYRKIRAAIAGQS